MTSALIVGDDSDNHLGDACTRTGRLRFLVVTSDEFPPFRPDVETLFATELVRRGHRIDWIMRSARNEGPTGRVQWRGGEVWLARTDPGLRRIDRLRKHLAGLRNDLRVIRLARANRYDFVQVKDKFLVAPVAWLAARCAGARFVYWLSFPFPEASLLRAKVPNARYPWFSLVRGLTFQAILYGLVARTADHIFVQSEEMKRRMAARGVPAEKMTAVPMGVDTGVIEDAVGAQPHATRRRAAAILYLGSLERRRGLDFLLRAFAIVARTHPSAELWFVGDAHEPEDRKFLESEAQRLGLHGRVVFTGFLPRERALALVRDAAVCVSPIPPDPVYDVASPTKILEYLALAKPVVASAQPDQRLVLEESGGGICTAYEPEAFAGALTWVLDHPQEAVQMGERGREYVRSQRTYRTIADRLEECYARLAER